LKKKTYLKRDLNKIKANSALLKASIRLERIRLDMLDPEFFSQKNTTNCLLEKA